VCVVAVTTFVAGATAVGSPYSEAVLSDSPMGYWRLDETSGPTFFDETANNNDGTISGSVVLNQSGAIADGNGAAEFAGGSVSFGTVTGLRDNFSVEFWINPQTRTNYNQTISADSGWSQFRFHTGNNGPVWVGTGCCGTAKRFESSDLGNGTFELNTWQHFVFTFEHLDATDGTATFYKNGSPLVTRALDKGSTWTGFNLEADLDGLVDEVAVYDSVLSATRVQAHYDASFIPEPATLGVIAAGLAVLPFRRRRAR